MIRISVPTISLAVVGLAALVALPACSVNVKKAQNGDDKQVDISTPVGGIHVSKNADARDVGVPVYPGARVKQKDSDGSDKSANVNISGLGFGLRVIALEYESDDTAAKIVAFYKDQLKQYGTVLECRTSGHVDFNMDTKDHGHGDHPVTCEGGDRNGNNVELKVGTRENQHIVAVEPDGKGANFSLVYVRTHGKDADI
jgi:hypothetical protein